MMMTFCMSVVPFKKPYALLLKPVVEPRRIEEGGRHCTTLDVPILDCETAPCGLDIRANAVRLLPPLADRDATVEAPRYSLLAANNYVVPADRYPTSMCIFMPSLHWNIYRTDNLVNNKKADQCIH